MTETDAIDQEIEQPLAAYRASAAFASEQALAESGACPDPAEVAALSAGTITVPWRRAALARHLVACPRCADENLALLLALDRAEDEGHHGEDMVARPRFRIHLRPAILASAAALLLAAAGLGPLGIETSAPAIREAYGVDRYGFLVRNPDPLLERIQVTSTTHGYVALARLSASGIELEPMRSSELMIEVFADEQVVLPTDRVLALEGDDEWLVLHCAKPLGATELAELARNAAAGALPPGVASARLRFSPRH